VSGGPRDGFLIGGFGASIVPTHRRAKASYSRRQLLPKARIAASRVAAYPWVGVRRSWWGIMNAQIHGLPTGAAFALNMRPTTAPLQSTSKSSSLQCRDERLADARLRISTSRPASIVAISLYPHVPSCSRGCGLSLAGACVKHLPPKRFRNASAVAASGKQNRM